MVKAIIFDCFGVLATEAWIPFKAKYFGHDPELMERVTDISRQANRGLISRQEAVRETSELAGITAAEVSQAIGGNVPNEELFAYIRQLKPKYKIGFLSNIAENYLHQIFTPEHLEVFDGISLSFEKGWIKPEAEAYHEAAQDLGVEVADSIMVDDQERNVSGAREAGMQAILYTNFDDFKSELEKLLKA